MKNLTRSHTYPYGHIACNTMGDVLPSTDPYATHEEPNPDRLVDKPSTTPLMIGPSGVVRVLALVAIAAFLTYSKWTAAPISIDTTFGGLSFPSEIKIHGSHQFAVGGGAAPFGALAVYVKMTPDRVTSPPAIEWAALDQFADSNLRSDQSVEGFVDVLSTAEVHKSLLLQFDGQTDVGMLSRTLSGPLASVLGEAALHLVQQALESAVQAPEAPARGGQLYVTCDQKKAHFAYGAPATGKKVRNMAPVSASLDSPAQSTATTVCQALFRVLIGGAAPIAPDARAGVAAGFTAQYGRVAPQSEDVHDEL